MNKGFVINCDLTLREAGLVEFAKREWTNLVKSLAAEFAAGDERDGIVTTLTS